MKQMSLFDDREVYNPLASRLRPDDLDGLLPSRLARALWIEILSRYTKGILIMSRLARALWIEIALLCDRLSEDKVEARESLVD